MPGTVNTARGAAKRAGQVPDLGKLPVLRRDTFENILANEEEEVPVTPPKEGQVCQCGNIHCSAKTSGVTQGEDSILQSVPGALN